MDKTPTLEMASFQLRREQLAKQMGPNSIALIDTSPVSYRNADCDYKYRADSYFYYLTGFNEPESFAIIETFSHTDEYRYTLFCRERNVQQEIWHGYRVGTQGAIDEYGADEAYEITQLDEIVSETVAHKDTLYFLIGHRESLDTSVLTWLKHAESEHRNSYAIPKNIMDLHPILDEMRLIKSEQEVELIQHACNISVNAHKNAMQNVKVGMMEYQLEAELHYVFLKNGCEPAYNSIVGGGENACILHYVENNKVLNDGDLVLIDAGCEYANYASDITRTFPVNGKFSQEQKQLYQLVLNAQYAAIDASQEGVLYNQPHQAAVKVLTQGLIDLALLEGELNTLIEQKAYQRFYMHGTGHWLGLDVHDVGQYEINHQSRPLKEGMIITVEPGLYIAIDDKTVEEKWRGIGIRIEDDIMITKQGPKVLTAALVKEIDDIEQLMASHSH